jgi:hypothetical protein
MSSKLALSVVSVVPFMLSFQSAYSFAKDSSVPLSKVEVCSSVDVDFCFIQSELPSGGHNYLIDKSNYRKSLVSPFFVKYNINLQELDASQYKAELINTTQNQIVFSDGSQSPEHSEKSEQRLGGCSDVSLDDSAENCGSLSGAMSTMGGIVGGSIGGSVAGLNGAIIGGLVGSCAAEAMCGAANEYQKEREAQAGREAYERSDSFVGPRRP